LNENNPLILPAAQLNKETKERIIREIKYKLFQSGFRELIDK